jgi:hypothetical protein
VQENAGLTIGDVARRTGGSVPRLNRIVAYL